MGPRRLTLALTGWWEGVCEVDLWAVASPRSLTPGADCVLIVY